MLPPPTLFARVPFSPEFPTHRFTHADIERYATGERADGLLIGDVFNDVLFDNYELGVAFTSPAGSRTEFRRYGWPFGVLIYRYDADYDDVYAKTNPSSNVGTNPTGWFGWAYIDRRVDSIGRRETFLFSYHTLTGAPVVIVAAWGLGRILRWLAIAVHLCRRDGDRLRDRMFRRSSVLFALFSAVLVVALSAIPRIDPGYAFTANLFLPLTPTGTFTSDLAAFASMPDGEAALARVILDATADTDVSDEECLAIGIKGEIGIEQSSQGGGWPNGLLYIRKAEQTGFETTDAPSLSLTWHHSSVEATAFWSGPRQRGSYHTIKYDRGSHIALGLMGVWIGTGFGIWLTGWWVRRRTARRIERGWCVQCGYDLSGL